MLLLDFMAYGTADLYIDFINTLSWFRMYCVGGMEDNKADYVEGFQALEESYKALWFDDEEEKNFSKYIPSEFSIVLEKTRGFFAKKSLNEKQINDVGNILYDFLNKGEKSFRKRYFDFKIIADTKYDYSPELFHAVKDLLDDDHNDEAVLNAFKFLDSFLQNLLQLSPHDYHGEELINKAFAPNIGNLQLNTHPNEQVGLRNFFSGANAIFRNPSAHRFMRFENFDAAAIVAMVAVMARLAEQISKKK